MARCGRRAGALLAGTLLAEGWSFDYTEAGPPPDELLERVPALISQSCLRTCRRGRHCLRTNSGARCGLQNVMVITLATVVGSGQTVCAADRLGAEEVGTVEGDQIARAEDLVVLRAA